MFAEHTDSDFGDLLESDMTLLSLKKLTDDHFDWTALLNTIAVMADMNYTFTDNDQVLVLKRNTLAGLINLAVKTPARVVRNFIGFRVVEQFFKLTNKQARQQFTTSEQKPLWQMCLNDAASGLRPVYLRLYVDHVGRVEMELARHKMTQMWNNIKTSFQQSLMHEYDWLDQETREYALEKLASMGSYLGYPDWIFQDEILDREFGFDSNHTDALQMVKGHYAEGYFQMMRARTKANFRLYRNLPSLKEM